MGRTHSALIPAKKWTAANVDRDRLPKTGTAPCPTGHTARAPSDGLQTAGTRAQNRTSVASTTRIRCPLTGHSLGRVLVELTVRDSTAIEIRIFRVALAPLAIPGADVAGRVSRRYSDVFRARLGCTRGGSPGILGKSGGNGSSPRPAATSRSHHRSNPSIDPGVTCMASHGSPTV